LIFHDDPAFWFESVVGPVLDFLTQDPGVDPARIALLEPASIMARSGGGADR